MKKRVGKVPNLNYNPQESFFLMQKALLGGGLSVSVYLYLTFISDFKTRVRQPLFAVVAQSTGHFI